VKRPTLTEGPATRHQHPGEVIREVTMPSGLGALLSVRDRDGVLVVEVYRADSDLPVRMIGGTE
jgi:hypothetical protein